MIAITTELFVVILVALAISTVSAIVIWRHTRTTTHACAREDCRRCQTVRFRQEPRVGTRVGFKDLAGWCVAEVERVDAAGRVELTSLAIDPFGTSRWPLGWWHVDELWWFPPDTPLGVYAGTVDDGDGDDANNDGADNGEGAHA